VSSPSGAGGSPSHDFSQDGTDGEPGGSLLDSFQPPSETADAVIDDLSAAEDVPKIRAALEASLEVGGDVQLIHLAQECLARLSSGLTLEAEVEKLQDKRCVCVWGGGGVVGRGSRGGGGGAHACFYLCVHVRVTSGPAPCCALPACARLACGGTAPTCATTPHPTQAADPSH
jgi:hypothetical protein